MSALSTNDCCISSLVLLRPNDVREVMFISVHHSQEGAWERGLGHMVADRELRDKAEARGGGDLQRPATVTRLHQPGPTSF